MRPFLFECNADLVSLDPDDPALEHDTVMLAHKLKAIGDVARIRRLNSGPSAEIFTTLQPMLIGNDRGEMINLADLFG